MIKSISNNSTTFIDNDINDQWQRELWHSPQQKDATVNDHMIMKKMLDALKIQNSNDTIDSGLDEEQGIKLSPCGLLASSLYFDLNNNLGLSQSLNENSCSNREKFNNWSTKNNKTNPSNDYSLANCRHTTTFNIQNNENNKYLRTINKNDSNYYYNKKTSSPDNDKTKMFKLGKFNKSSNNSNINNNNLNKNNKFNTKTLNQQNPIPNSYRKKSIGPLSMQSVRESRSPSPYNFKRQLTEPVNIQKKNRLRTMSGTSSISNGSFNGSPSSPSTFSSSSFGGNSTEPYSPHRKHSLNNDYLSNSFNSLNLSDSMILIGQKLAHTGNMFNTRVDWSLLSQVPLHKQNSIHIRVEDEGPYGNDQTRCFLLSHFSTLGIRTMSCVLCKHELDIYDSFPLVDGTLYCSPINYNKSNQQIEKDPKNSDSILSVSANISNKTQYIYVVCLKCLHSTDYHETFCRTCNKQWTGGADLQIGTMYRFDIFAAFPCCQKRTLCKNCQTNILISNEMNFFSFYSEEITCQKCELKDYHFVKPLDIIYDIKSKKM